MQPSEHFVEYDEDGDKILDVGKLSLEEQEHFQKARQEHRLNMTKQQKIGAKVFIGDAFIAIPERIEFCDFTVGKPQRLQLKLTNVSNAFNSFNVLPLPQRIRNYFQVDYVPRGKVSPGIICSIKFTFFPQLDQDITSEFTILAETGKISFPIVCTSKKTIVKCNQTELSMGNIIFGEVGKTKLKVENKGSLPSELTIKWKDSQEQIKHGSDLKFTRNLTIGGNTEKMVDFELVPKGIGKFKFQLQLFTKNSLHSPMVPFTVFGECVEVSVRIEQEVSNLQICLIGHIYREKLVFFNSAETSMSFKIVQPAETRKYFEFNPAIGYIQKQSKIEIWAKFSAEKDLQTLLSNFEVAANQYQVPFQLSVKQQVLAVHFRLRFRITSDRVVITPPELNFGTIFQGLSSKLQVTFDNESDLPQQILLYMLPKQIQVEYDQPLFKLLPKQKVKTYITYRSKQLEDSGKPFKDEGKITCKLITGQIGVQQIKLEFVCETVRSQLHVLHNKIDLPALQVDQLCQASTVLRNNSNKDIIYEIVVPNFEVCGLMLTPVVKELQPKQDVEVSIRYFTQFRKLTYATLSSITNQKPKETTKTEEKQAEAPKGAKDSKKQTKLTKQQQQALQAQQKKQEEEERLRKEREAELSRQMEESFNGQAELEKMGGKVFDFGDCQHYRWLLPVYFKQKDYPDASAEINFLQITTTATQKTLVCDQPVIDFGEIAVGGKAVKDLTITNKGKTAFLQKKQMPIFCCFSLQNSLRSIEQGKTYKAVLEFQPIEEQKFEQRLVFFTDHHTVSCLLKGRGVRPVVEIEPQNGFVSFGGVLIEQFAEKSFKIKNICNFDTVFYLQTICSGALNTDGSKAITFTPMNGPIKAHSVVEVKVKFRPDRIGENFFEKIKINVPEQKTQRKLFVTGSCYLRQGYICDFKQMNIPDDRVLLRNLQSAADWIHVKDEDTVYGPTRKTILLEFKKQEANSVSGKEEQDETCLKRRITVGNSRMVDSKLQKPFNFQIVMPKQDRIQCDNLKGTVTAGTEATVTFTLKPTQPDPFLARIPELADVGQWRELKAELKVSGGFVKTGQDAFSFDLLFRVYLKQL